MMKLRWVGAYLGDVCEEPVTYMKSSKVYEARLDGTSRDEDVMELLN